MKFALTFSKKLFLISILPPSYYQMHILSITSSTDLFKYLIFYALRHNFTNLSFKFAQPCSNYP